MEEEALSETGNVILNSCLATMANMLKRPLTMSIPTVCKGSASTLFEDPEKSEKDARVLFLYINFSIQQRDLRGYIAMTMDMPSLQSLKELLAEFIEQVVGEPE
jgi:chemotaxis protein CheC